MIPPALVSPQIKNPHGFFGRAGGVSEPPFDSLNASLASGDDQDAVATNRGRIAEALNSTTLLTAKQVHGDIALVVDEPFSWDDRPEADALVTSTPGLAVGVLTADCVPLVFDGGNVVAAAHAGWRGSLAGIIESTVALMEQHGADRSTIVAATGPALRRDFFEVRQDLIDTVTSKYPEAEQYFAPLNANQWLYDHMGFVRDRLSDAGIDNDRVYDTGGDTLGEPERFFSYRGALQAGRKTFGHNASAIARDL